MKKIAILGFGTIGGGVADVIDINRESIEAQIGDKVEVAHILDLRTFPDSPYHSIVTSDYDEILNDESVDIVVEAMGGSHPAYDFSLAALKAGKHVVSSNKEVVANFGKELLQAAKDNGVRYLFEASVGGGIPIIRPLNDSLAGNKICSVRGILNGTTNYILTEMSQNGKSFAAALKEAQEKGYAERNPEADVEGIDAKRKILILAALAFGKIYSEADVKNVGITKVETLDAKILSSIGAKIKLVGFAENIGEKKVIGVEPCVALRDNPLCSVDGVFNGILVSGNALGDIMFYGSGAGKLPTASAVVADIMDIFLNPDKKESTAFTEGAKCDIDDGYDIKADYYVRCERISDTLVCDKIAETAYIVHGVSRRELDALGYKTVYRIL